MPFISFTSFLNECGAKVSFVVSHLCGLRRSRADLDRVQDTGDARDRSLGRKGWSRMDEWRAVSKG